jgi:tmRNA-binding protein
MDKWPVPVAKISLERGEILLERGEILLTGMEISPYKHSQASSQAG